MPRALQRPFEHAVALRVRGLETEILEFELQAVQAEPLGDRRVDLERLARNRAAACGRHRI
ncbi:MAG: hypothetical protein KIT78_07535, partial [Steroidobacteraceae bacterium]|nr:hypothetical protein [Steroidobacteraceae bacterium]